MGQGNARIYNVVSLVFFILTVIAVALIGSQMSQPAPEPTEVLMVLPTRDVLPTITVTFTPTHTPTETITPSITPSVTPSVTTTGTRTPIPTVTPSLTHTPSAEPSETNTPLPTSTGTIIPSATIPPSATTPLTATTPPTRAPSLTITSTLRAAATQVPVATQPAQTNSGLSAPPPTLGNAPSPFPFGLRDGQPVFTANFANSAGCSWQGIGGQVFDSNDQPLLGVNVHVFGPNLDVFVTSGSNTIYGVSGWEVPVGNAISNSTYRVELQSAGGTVISSQITVTFPGNCSGNLALLNFKQTRPF